MSGAAERYKACILGCSLETGNRGVSALTASLAEALNALVPGIQLSLFIGSRSPHAQWVRNGKQDIRLDVLQYRLSPRARPRDHMFFILLLALLYRLTPFRRLRKAILTRNHVLSALSEMDFIGDIRGGDSFSDIYGTGRFILNCLPALVVLAIGRPLVLLPQTYGPYKKKLARRMAGIIIRRTRFVLGRDQENLSWMSGLFKLRPHFPAVRFCPDVAFLMSSRMPDGYLPPPARGGRGKKKPDRTEHQRTRIQRRIHA